MTVFYSFHYQNDHWRVQQIRNKGSIDKSGLVASQEWEKARLQTDQGIKNWIDRQMNYKSAVVVLIGAETASRKWVQYEIQRAWDMRKPLLGIRIHGLKDNRGNTSREGSDPFVNISGLGGWNSKPPIFDPTVRTYGGAIDSQATYAKLAENLEHWIKQGRTRY